MAGEKQQEAAGRPDPEDTKKEQGSSWRTFLRWDNPNLWLAVLILIAIIVLGYVCGNQIFTWITEAKEWFLDELPFSLVVYYIVFCLCAMVLIPYGPFCIAVGYVFGLGWGLLIQVFALFLSASLLFLVGRYAFKEKVDEFMSKSEGSRVWKGLMKYMAKDWKEAAKINVLLCFMPIPYGSHPYLFSLSTVPFEQFVVFFMLGMLPNTVLNLLIGEALEEATLEAGVSIYHLIGTGLAIAGCVAAVWYASTIAQKVLDEADAEEPTEKDRLLP